MKYKFSFKALDSRDQYSDRSRIRRFLSGLGYQDVSDKEGFQIANVYYFQKGRMSLRHFIKVMWDNDQPLVAKYYQLVDLKKDNQVKVWRYCPFTNEELKFFDNIGYLIASVHKDQTGEEVDEWFDKKDRKSSEDLWNIRDAIVRFYRQNPDLNKFKYAITGAAGEDVHRVVYEIDDVEYTVISDLKRMKVEKTYNDGIMNGFEMMSIDELELFKKLGFTLGDIYANNVGQKI